MYLAARLSQDFYWHKNGNAKDAAAVMRRSSASMRGARSGRLMSCIQRGQRLPLPRLTVGAPSTLGVS